MRFEGSYALSMNIPHRRANFIQLLTLSGNTVRGHHAAKKALHIASWQEAVRLTTQECVLFGFMCSSGMLETGQ